MSKADIRTVLAVLSVVTALAQIALVIKERNRT